MTPIEIASCIILDDYGRLLLLHANIGGTYWDLPGGLVDEDEAPELAVLRTVSEQLAVEITLVGSLGSELIEEDDAAYQYHWYQAVISRGQPTIAYSDTFDDLDYFELEDMPSLALSHNMLTLYPKIYSGEISIDSSLS